MMPSDALDVVRRHDAVLLGAVGDPSVPDHVTLWGLLLPLARASTSGPTSGRCGFLEGVPSPLAGAPTVDMLFVRENTEGEYAGVGGRAHQGLEHEVGLETSVFTRVGVRRVISHAFDLAAGRRGVVTSATKSNASRYGYVLWDEVAAEVAAEYPDVRSTSACWSTRSPRDGERPGELRRRGRLQPLRRHPHRPGGRAAGRAGNGCEREPHPAPATRASSSRSTGPPRTSPARGSPTRSARSGAPR